MEMSFFSQSCIENLIHSALTRLGGSGGLVDKEEDSFWAAHQGDGLEAEVTVHHVQQCAVSLWQ